MEDISVKGLMETLTSQQVLLQQLYRELDMEREATESAASESLSMIRRLQGEKAAVEMEASQYKRMAEEKIVHTEETLDVFRDLVYQKEMQVASLEFQVQAYRFKLMSLNCDDVGVTESTYPGKNKIMRSNGGTFWNIVRRRFSLPPDLLRYREELTTDLYVRGETSVQVLPEMKDQNNGHVKSGDYDSYWEQIGRLDERVKLLFGSGNKLNEVIRSCSLQSHASSNSLYDENEALEHLVDIESSKEPATPAKVHDIFEVPETTNGGEVVTLPRSKKKLVTEDEICPVTPVTPDAIKAVISDGVDKKILDQRITVSLDMDNAYPNPQDGLDIEQLYLKRPDDYDLELQQMNKRLKRLENERIMARQEIMREEDEANFLLMKSIKDQLNSIEDEIKQWRPKKSPPPKKEVDLTTLSEAMLHFWL